MPACPSGRRGRKSGMLHLFSAAFDSEPTKPKMVCSLLDAISQRQIGSWLEGDRTESGERFGQISTPDSNRRPLAVPITAIRGRVAQLVRAQP